MSEPRLQAVARAATPPQGDPALIAVDRALGELRTGQGHCRARRARSWRLVVPLETADAALVDYILRQDGAALVVTGARAAALQVPCESDEVLLLTLPAGLDAEQVRELGHHWEADGWRTALGGAVPQASCADALCMGAVQLAKSAQLLPALLVTPVQAGRRAGQRAGRGHRRHRASCAAPRRRPAARSARRACRCVKARTAGWCCSATVATPANMWP